MTIGNSKQLYTEIWNRLRPQIIETIEKGENALYPLKQEWFIEASNRQSYSMKIEYDNGQCSKKTNSAVARDLMHVLEDSPKFKQVCNNRHVVIRLSSSFVLQIEVKQVTLEESEP